MYSHNEDEHLEHDDSSSDEWDEFHDYHWSILNASHEEFEHIRKQRIGEHKLSEDNKRIVRFTYSPENGSINTTSNTVECACYIITIDRGCHLYDYIIQLVEPITQSISNENENYTYPRRYYKLMIDTPDDPIRGTKMWHYSKTVQCLMGGIFRVGTRFEDPNISWEFVENFTDSNSGEWNIEDLPIIEISI